MIRQLKKNWNWNNIRKKKTCWTKVFINAWPTKKKCNLMQIYRNAATGHVMTGTLCVPIMPMTMPRLGLWQDLFIASHFSVELEGSIGNLFSQVSTCQSVRFHMFFFHIASLVLFHCWWFLPNNGLICGNIDPPDKRTLDWSFPMFLAYK